jgi:hypothetical protein
MLMFRAIRAFGRFSIQKEFEIIIMNTYSIVGFLFLLLGIMTSRKAIQQAGVPLFLAMVNALHETGSLMPLTRMVESMVALAAPEARDVIKDMMLTCPVEVASGMLSNLDAVTNDMTGLVAEVATKPCLAIWPGPKPAGVIRHGWYALFRQSSRN